jgi:hypothetical protein
MERRVDNDFSGGTAGLPEAGTTGSQAPSPSRGLWRIFAAALALLLIGWVWSLARRGGDREPGDSAKPTADGGGWRTWLPSEGEPAWGEHPLDAALDLARQALERLDEVTDYTAVLVKQERLSGRLGPEVHMELKFHQSPPPESGGRAGPRSIYLHFLEPSNVRGREVIWVEDRHEGKITAHEGGWFGVLTVHLEPTGSLAMRGERYPITQLGLRRLLEQLLERGLRDRRLGDCVVSIEPGHELGGVSCIRVRVEHPEQRPGYDFHIAEIFIDPLRLIPIGYAAFGWPPAPGAPPVLEERYTYRDVLLNAGLSESDFDPANPDYRFPLAGN